MIHTPFLDASPRFLSDGTSVFLKWMMQNRALFFLLLSTLVFAKQNETDSGGPATSSQQGKSSDVGSSEKQASTGTPSNVGSSDKQDSNDTWDYDKEWTKEKCGKFCDEIGYSRYSMKKGDKKCVTYCWKVCQKSYCKHNDISKTTWKTHGNCMKQCLNHKPALGLIPMS
ncbi:unnamed protein product [Cylicocyclus nassatus]|uniref:Uncharacterized protein n=1 Tax=Cylicocyclus nassatus TaxID=53992 RepID=A0AA36M6Q4_CYLNA|nr:unnamed protein product [Cylicocyclus nassatus]